MEDDSPHNANPFLLKEDLFSAYLNQNNPNAISDPWKFSQEDFFFRPETNYLNKYFENDKLSNISQGEQFLFKNDFNNEENDNKNQQFSSKKISESTQESTNLHAKVNTVKAELALKPRVIIEDNNKEKKDISDKEIKLLKNRLSARKCRQKKKSYMKQLEEEVDEYRNELAKYKTTSKKEKNFENCLHKIDEQEKELGLLTEKKQIEATKIEYLTNQRRLLNELFVRQIKLMMPIDCKVFHNKFLKMAQFEYEDSNGVLLNKINSNIQMLKELYDFKKKPNQECKGKIATAYKLFLFYENLKQFTELFIKNCYMI